jgi:hypothetical protein
LARVHLVVSRSPLGKAPGVPSFDDRVDVLREVASTRPWLEVRVTDRQLIAEVATGYDAVIMGMDKWLQVLDPAWYGGSADRRDAALAALPSVLLAAREGSAAPDLLRPGVRLLDVAPAHGPVSSSLVRAGRVEWMLDEAARFDARTGAWTDADRYQTKRPGRGGRSAEDAPIQESDPASLRPMADPDQPPG